MVCMSAVMSRLKPSCFFLALGILLSVIALIIWVVRSRELREAKPPQDPVPQGPVDNGSGDGGRKSTVDRNQDFMDDDIPGLRKNPGMMMDAIAEALEKDDMVRFSKLLGSDINEQALAQLLDFAAAQKALGRKARVREVGELELNKRTRWAIEFGEGDQKRTMYLDLKRDGEQWTVEKITVAPEAGPDGVVVVGDDALAAAEAFLQAVLAQKFEVARQFVDGGKVTDARIAGLCILFEEGQYRMRANKPVRAMFQRADLAGFMANVEAADGTQNAQFALTLARQGDPAAWVVSEINLDQLLADYAQRVAGGDVYYSPLVKNPEGGDTLALYFGFDEDEISPRTRRQLEIVAQILKTDPVKKLTLSGHTDAKGTDAYNDGLSMRRAEVVRDFLIASGVHAGQIVTVAKGASQPRRPNVTETGADNPDGRKVNRRTEIYLDF